MKKYILIFVLILLQFKSLNSQTIASYMLSIKSYGVHIHLFDTNKYILSITIASSLDDISKYDLSYGTFTKDGNKIILKDKINGSEINLLKEDNDLLTDKGLVCFNNQSFIYTNNLFLFSNNYKELDSIANLKYKEIIHNNESCNINVGKYPAPKFYDIDGDGIDEILSIEILSNKEKVVNTYKWEGFGFQGFLESKSFTDIRDLKVMDDSVYVEVKDKRNVYRGEVKIKDNKLIMLGLASEKIIDEKLDALLGFLSRNFNTEFLQMQSELANIRMASGKFNCYKKYFDKIKNNVSDLEFKKMLPTVDKVAFQTYANFTRITRNELAHPYQSMKPI